MRRSFGQFKAAVKEKSLLSTDERAIVHAFNQGAEIARNEGERRSPYMPTGEQERHEAWLAGYDEYAPERYRLASATDLGDKHAGRSAAPVRSLSTGRPTLSEKV